MSMYEEKPPLSFVRQSGESQRSEMSHGVGKKGGNFMFLTAFTRIVTGHHWMHIFHGIFLATQIDPGQKY